MSLAAVIGCISFMCDVKLLLLSGLDVRDILFYEIYSLLFTINIYIL